MFEFPALLLPINLVQPVHSPSALTEQVSLNLAGAFLLHPVSQVEDFHIHLGHPVPYRFSKEGCEFCGLGGTERSKQSQKFEDILYG